MSEVKTTTSGITEQHVAAYLQQHPDFFQNNQELLLNLNLPHDSKGTVSLVERQVGILRERNQDMRARLSSLIENAKANDALFENSKQLVLSLLPCADLSQFNQQLHQQMLSLFNLDFCRFTLLSHQNQAEQTGVTFNNPQQAPKALAQLKNQQAICGQLGDDEYQYLFGDKHPGSCAVIAINQGSFAGLLAIGKNDSQHFKSSMGTLFLAYIASVCERLLPKLLE